MFGAALNPLNMVKGVTQDLKMPGLPIQYPGMNKNLKNLQIPMLLRVKMWLGLEIHDGDWCKSQTDAELAVFAETVGTLRYFFPIGSCFDYIFESPTVRESGEFPRKLDDEGADDVQASVLRCNGLGKWPSLASNL